MSDTIDLTDLTREELEQVIEWHHDYLIEWAQETMCDDCELRSSPPEW